MIICFIGPKLMAKRQPFELKGVLIVYNFGMVLLSVYMFKEVIKLVMNIITDDRLSILVRFISAAISLIIGT